MWIKLLSKGTIESDGSSKQYNPGDFVDVSRKTAMRLIAARLAVDPDPGNSNLLPLNAGIIAYGNTVPNRPGWDIVGNIHELYGNVGFINPEPLKLEYRFNIVWQTDHVLNIHRIPVGFALLETWELAVAIDDYDILIADIVPDSGRAELTERMFDLRVPALLPGFFYVRRTPTTEQLVAKFVEYTPKWGASVALSLAIFETKPFWLALPVTWANETGADPYAKS